MIELNILILLYSCARVDEMHSKIKEKCHLNDLDRFTSNWPALIRNTFVNASSKRFLHLFKYKMNDDLIGTQ